MKIVINDNLGEVHEKLTELGHEVYSDKESWFSTMIEGRDDDWLEDWCYPLNRFLAQHAPVDICILVDPWRYPGIRKAHAVKWLFQKEGRVLVYWNTQDPINQNEAKTLSRCKCRKSNASLVVSNDHESAKRNTMFAVSAHYTGDAGSLVGLIEGLASGQPTERLHLN